MLDEDNLSTLLNENMSRLLMMDEDFEYEFDVPGREARLGIVGGAKQSEFLITPIDTSNDQPVEKPARTFLIRSGPPIEIAGKTSPNTVEISEHEPRIEMSYWLQAEPWDPDPTTVVFCECGCQETPGCTGNCCRPECPANQCGGHGNLCELRADERGTAISRQC